MKDLEFCKQTGVPGGVISSGAYIMKVDFASNGSWSNGSTPGPGMPGPSIHPELKEKIYVVTERLKKIK
jgi:hypothetical protein